MQIAYAMSFEAARAGLDAGDLKHVTDAVLKLQRGLNVKLHTLNANDWMSFYVNRNALRVICQRDGDTLLLVHVGQHDKAYEWARRHKVAQIGRVVRVVRTVVDTADNPVDQGKVEVPPGPLAEIPSKWFRRLSVPDGLVPTLRGLTDEDVLNDLAMVLAPPLGEALIELHTEPDAWAEVVNRFARRKEELTQASAPEPSLSEALRDQVNAGSFWLPPGEKALRRALEGDMALWRVFLHPSQQRIVDRNSKGALKVTGGPGTGKTIVALHRARRLAQEVFADDPRPVLFTTFSKALSLQVDHLLDHLCDDVPGLRQRIEVRTITAAAQQILRTGGKGAELLTGDIVERCWSEAMTHDTADLSERFYRAERRHVVEPWGVWAGAQYLRVSRKGRHKRLSRGQKKHVWNVLEAFEAALARRGGGDGPALARDATMLVRTGQVASPWCAVVCDEVQDTGASELRLLAALAANDVDGKTRPNALFLAGDGYQRLSGAGVPLSRCGIEIVGRSHTLRLNYRTTEGIRRAAVGVVKGIDVDELDDVPEDGLGSLRGYRSIRRGPVPESHTFANTTQEVNWIAESARDAPGTTLVLARTNPYLDQLQERLTAAGAQVRRLGRRDEVEDVPGLLVLCSLHRAKGLEAPRVIVAGRQLLPAPWNGEGDETDRRTWNRREKCLLYVGITRARDWCALTGCG